MDVLLQAIIIILMLFLCALCLFAVVVIVRDIIFENSQRKERLEATPAPVQAPTPQPVIIQMTQAEPVQAPAPAPAPVVEVEPEVQEPATNQMWEEPACEEIATALPELDEELVAEEDEDPNSVAFSRNTLTMEEKYATLSTEFKRYFDDIVNHTLQKEGVKENRKANAYDYKIGSQRVIRLSIRRGEIVCEFNFIDKDFNQYANASGVKIKRAATVVRVTEPSAVGVAKDGVDLVCVQIEELKQQKKELANEKRRQRRKAAKESSAE